MPGQLLQGLRWPQSPTDGECRAAEELLGSLDRRTLSAYFRQIVDDDRLLLAVASRSSVHANGFVKVVLERGEHCALRLHFWAPESPAGTDTDENIHDHIWSFASRILLGRLTDERFVKQSNGQEAREFDYVRKAETAARRGDLDFQEVVRLASVAELTHREDDVYSLDPEVLHRANCSGGKEFGTTLAITGRIRKPRAKVYALKGELVREDPDENLVTPDKVAEILRMVAEKI